MKKRKHDVYILLLYCVPYVFLGMLGDYVYGTMWLYLLGAAVMLLLSCYCRKTNGFAMVLSGNLLSLGTSWLCTYLVATEKWNYYFKAFPASIRTVQFSLVFTALQLIPWWYKKITE